jgi:hypothetical protein
MQVNMPQCSATKPEPMPMSLAKAVYHCRTPLRRKPEQNSMVAMIMMIGLVNMRTATFNARPSWCRRTTHRRRRSR